MKNISIIGCGAIGTDLALAIDKEHIKNAKLVSVFDSQKEKGEGLVKRLKNKSVTNYTDFKNFYESLKNEADVIVECASQQAVKIYLIDLLKLNKEILLMSVGALVDKKFLSNIELSAKEHKSTIHIPSGAIAGIDAIKSVKKDIKTINLTTTKNPQSLSGAPFIVNNKIDIKKIKNRKVLFSGTADEAVKLFPANINVAAILSLSGIGFKKTTVNIVADPKIKINQHEINVKGDFGELVVTVKNKPSRSNPKTSYLAILSAIEYLDGLCRDGIKIGT